MSDTVDARLAAGWRPVRSLPRMWQRGGRLVQVGEDRVEDLSGAELEAMSEAEEQVLIGRRWADG